MEMPKASDADKEHFRSVVPDHPGVIIKPMFGNLGAFVNGNMFAGLFGPTIGVKLSEADKELLESTERTVPFGPAKRPIGGYTWLPEVWNPEGDGDDARGKPAWPTSYWLSSVEHQLLERRGALGGAWHDRWDSFYLKTPNFAFLLPELICNSPEPDAFLPRDEVIGLFRDYAARIKAPVRLGSEVARVGVVDGRFTVETKQGRPQARNVVLANGTFQRPRMPASAAKLPERVRQLHSHGYRNPQELPGGAVMGWAPGSPAGRSPRTCWTPAGRCTSPSRPARRLRGGTACRTFSTGSCSSTSTAPTTASTDSRRTSSPPRPRASCATR